MALTDLFTPEQVIEIKKIFNDQFKLKGLAWKIVQEIPVLLDANTLYFVQDSINPKKFTLYHTDKDKDMAFIDTYTMDSVDTMLSSKVDKSSISNATSSNSSTTVASSKALNEVRESLTNSKVDKSSISDATSSGSSNTVASSKALNDVREMMLAGINGEALTTTTPPNTGFYRYVVHSAGTYTNFLAGGVPIEVTTADLDGNMVFLEVTDNVAKKVVAALPVAPVTGVVESGNTQAVSGGEVFSNLSALATKGELNKLDSDTKAAQQFVNEEETEFKYSVVDLNNYVVFGIRFDGSVYMPRGIPDELKDVLPRLSELVSPIVNEIDSDPNYMYKILDINGDVLLGIRPDSTVEIQKLSVFDFSFIENAMRENELISKYGRNFSPIATTFETDNPIIRHIHSFGDVAGYPYPRIPAMQITSNVNMLVAYEVRNLDDDKGEISIYVSRSVDGGGTFTKSSVFQYTPNSRYMNPSFVMDKTGANGLAGRIYLFAIKIKDDTKYFGGLTNKNQAELVYKYTDDDGATWSVESSLQSLTPSNVLAFGSSPANGIQLDNGILVLPAMISLGISPTSISANYRSGIFYKHPSMDWQFVFIDNEDSFHDNECTIIGIGNRVLINIRNERNNTRKVYVSSEISTSTMASSVTFEKREESETFSSYGICQGSLCKINYEGDECYLFSTPDYLLSQIQRQYICIWISFDLKAWYPMYYVTTNQISNGYSSISFHQSGVLSIAYENNSSPFPDVALEKQISYQDVSFLLNRIPEYKLLLSKYEKKDDLLIYKHIKDLKK